MRKQDHNFNCKARNNNEDNNNNKCPIRSMASSALLAARLFCNQSMLLFPSRKQPSIEERSRRKVLIISSQKNKSKTYHKIEEEEKPIISSITNNAVDTDYFLPLSPSSSLSATTTTTTTTSMITSKSTKTTRLIQKTELSSIMKRPRRRRRVILSSERTRFQREATSISFKAVNNNLLFLTVLIASIAITSSIQLANCSMCQHHQAMIEAAAAAAAASSASNSPSAGSGLLPVAGVQSQNLIICPKSSQHNNLPQFPPRYISPTLERQQREILNQLNISFANHLQLNGSPSSHLEVAAKQNLPAATSNAEATSSEQLNLPNELIDDELLNEIISPLVVDAAYERAKELIVKRRKLENELVKNGFITDMSKPTAVARHQRVTTTTTRGNELEKTQEVFEEMSRILAKNLSNTINLRFAKPSEAAARQLGQVSQLGNGRTPNSNSGSDDSNKATGSTGSIGLGESASENVDELLSSSNSDLLETADSSQILSRIDLHSSEARHAVSRCEEDQMIVCDPNFPYRHADGRCNNLQHPSWGKANTCFARLLPPDYSDGQSAPRISVTGHPLPNPRILSAIVHRDFNYPATYTHFVMQYGQFFAHDIAFTPSSRTKSGQMIQCCPIERDSHPQCFPILVPPDDPFYSNWEESCLNFVRTAVCPRCRLGPREQMNQITSFVDGSQVYGSAANETAALWTKNGPAGRMHVSLDDAGRELLPHSADPSNDQCSDIEKRQFCYRAGDRRVNQHPALTSVHVMWLRQHNRVVNALKMINPHWNGDRLYQEAKRICTAQMQMVTYNEWLSLIIGQEAMKFLKLNVMPTGYTKYDQTVDPSLLNEFSGAAFRFGHSMINNIFAEILPDGRPSGYRLNEFFFHPFGMKSGQHDMVMRGLISQASQNRDPFVSSDIKNHLYRPRDNPYGLDLPAFNIQRGRDHGIPGYTKLVEFCFDDVITNWKQLDQYMPVSQRIRFSKLYRSVHDLDLFSAGLAEYPLPGAALGPTFTCIVGIQMFNLKYGDRFWFEHGGQVGSFTPDQLQEIRKTNLARLMCANSDNMNIIQKNVFRGESPSNPSVPCSSLPDTDLKAWMEAPGTKSIFSQTSSMVEDDSSKGAEGGGGGKRKRRQRPKQEPLAYAFRGSRGSGNHKKKQTTPLGNDYATIQRHPAPKMQQQQQQHQPPQQQNNSPQYSRPNQTPMNNGGGGGGGSQQNYGSGQQTNYMQTQNTNNRQVPFGMPIIRISLPKQAIQQSQQIYKQASSPAVTFDNTLLNIPPR